MASGPDLPVIYEGADGSSTSTAQTLVNMGTSPPSSHRRLLVCWADTTTAFSAAPAGGWQKLYDQTIGSMRCGIFYHGYWNVNVAAGSQDVQWNCGASAIWSVNGAGWEGLASDNPIVGTPVTASGAAASTMTIGGMTLGTGLSPIWFWAARFTSGASSRSITLPADLVSSGTITPTGTTGINARCGAWLSGTGGAGARLLQHPSGSTGTKSATVSSTSGMTKWSGIGLALRAVDQGGQIFAAA